MCGISIDTVRRANQKTMMQMRDRKLGSNGNTASKKSIDVSVSVSGRMCVREISAEKIKSSFGRALNFGYGKKI